MRTTWRTLQLARKASARGFVLVLVLTLVSAVVPPLVVALSRQVVDLIAHGPLVFATILPWAVGMGVLTVAQRLFSMFLGNRQQVFGWEVLRYAERLFLQKTSQSELERFDDPDWHDRVQRVSRDLQHRPISLTHQSMAIMGSLVTLTGMMGILLSLHPVLLLLSVAAVVVPVPFQRRVNRRIYEYFFRWTTKEREQWYYRYLLSDTRVAKDLRAYVLEKALLDRHQGVARERQEELRRLYANADRINGLGAVVGGTILVTAFVFVAHRASTGVLSAGDVTALIGALTSVTAHMSSVFTGLALIDQHAPFLEDFFDFLAVRPRIEVAANAVALPRPLPDKAAVELDNVVFHYPGVEKPAIDGLSLRVDRGQLCALVGENGAGKTTLLKLLLRFYDPQGGAVRIGGIDIRQADPARLRDRIGVLFQDYVNFTLRARDAVAFGRATRPPTDEGVWAALEAAHAADIVRALPQGLDGFVGRYFEKGKDLSGGQWQRLALARMMYRDADIWVLDEPTSSLDPEAEAAIFAELKQQLAGRVGIVISHRFSTVRIADRIAVVDGGRITEAGSHDELLAKRGRYARLFELQAAGYR